MEPVPPGRIKPARAGPPAGGEALTREAAGRMMRRASRNQRCGTRPPRRTSRTAVSEPRGGEQTMARLTINGKTLELDVEPDTPLL
ncbi:MAG TPA: hypothetical protein VN279_04805, partial [Rhodocyclaceae bacterium]|nr:hypothetical protein [Rhodocyclaceae bacterium]